MRFSAVTIGGLAMLLAAPAIVIAQQQAAAEPEEAYVSLQYRPYLNEVVTALYVRGSFFLPLGEVLSQLQIDHHLDPARGTITGFYLTEKRRYEIDLSTLTARVGGRTVTLPPGSLLTTELDYFVLPEVLREVFGWEVTVDAGSLTATVVAPEDLPAAALARREMDRSRVAGVAADTIVAPLRYRRERRLLDGGVIDYSLTGSHSASATDGSFDLGLGLEVLGGGLEGNLRGTYYRGDTRIDPGNVRWSYVVDDNRFLSQVTLGRIYSTGLVSTTLQGLELTNRPVRFRREVGSHVVQGETQPAWEVELYVNQQFAGYAVADALGRYRFTIPLTYGTSQVKLRFYGPTGEVREEEQAIQVPFTFLPAGETSYSLALGRVDATGRAATHASVALGMSSRITNTVGVQYIADTTSSHQAVLYNSLAARLPYGAIAGVDLAPSGFLRLSTEMSFPGQGHFGLTATRFSKASDLNPQLLTSELSVQGFLPFSLGSVGSTLRVQAIQRARETGATDQQLSTEITANVGGWKPSLGYTRTTLVDDGISQVTREELRAGMFLYLSRGLVWRALPGALLRSYQTYDLRTQSLRQATVDLSTQVARGRRLEVSYSRDFLSAQNQLEVRLQIELPFLHTSTSVRSQSNGLAMVQSVRGSLGLDASDGSILYGDRSWVGRAGASFRLFMDSNGNGVYDGGERVLPGGAIQFQQTVATRRGSNEVVRASDLLAYQRYSATIDPRSIRNPLWTPKYDEFSFETDPNQFKRIDVPFYMGGVVEGAVVRRIGQYERPLGGLKIRLLREDGGYETTLQTFRDGTFYQMGIPPGRYIASVDSAQLAILGDVAEPRSRSFEVRITQDGDYVDGIDFLLRSAAVTESPPASAVVAPAAPTSTTSPSLPVPPLPVPAAPVDRTGQP